MTFSIVARAGDALGVATATRSLAVGAVVPAAAPGVGALATQARTNRAFRSRGLELLAQGLVPAEVLPALGEEDDGFAERQVALVDAGGQAAVWTGPACGPWAGGWGRRDVAVAGNLLTGREVLDAMDAAFDAEPGASLARRLLTALTAGDAVGGDRRGRQSAALFVVAGGRSGQWPPRALVDLRVDDHADPVGELARLLDLEEAERAAHGTPSPAAAARGGTAGPGPSAS